MTEIYMPLDMQGWYNNLNQNNTATRREIKQTPHKDKNKINKKTSIWDLVCAEDIYLN